LIASIDKTVFIKVTVPPAEWPGHSWEVEEVLVVFTKDEIARFLRGPPSLPKYVGLSVVELLHNITIGTYTSMAFY
jgi:hypothetical protein